MTGARDPAGSDSRAARVSAANDARGALVLELRRSGVSNVDILRAIETVPRELFTPFRLRDLANRNCPLPIACGQTMHSPGVIAAMLTALAVEPHHRVMEIGAGAGYALAILSRLAREVVSFERFNSLAVEARARLAGLDVVNAEIVVADGFAAPERHGQFDRIIVHAALPSPPEKLFGALKPSGRIVCGLDGRDGERVAIVSPGVVQRLQSCRLGRPLSGVARAL